MFIPYSTDAPIYYWPYITVAMIVINVLAFLGEVASPESITTFALAVGDGLHPVQWLTNNFMHASPMHLIGNMISLWAFGLVVEGKLGPWKTLGVYLGIGVIYGATVQILLLGHEPTFCLGASAIVFGYMAMSLIWAPENQMNCFLLIWFRPFFFELQIQMLVGLFVALEVFILYMSGGALSSEFLHVVGALVGFAVGIGFLKAGWVDCEHWDIFSVWAGRHIMTDKERAKQDAESAAGKKRAAEQERQRQEKVAKHLDKMLEEIRLAIRGGNPLPAYLVARRTMHENPRWVLPEQELLTLIQSLYEKTHFSEAIEAMRLYLDHYAAKAHLVRMKLAQVFLLRNQPRTAKKALAPINAETLDTPQLKFYRGLLAKIETLETQDTYELVEDA